MLQASYLAGLSTSLLLQGFLNTSFSDTYYQLAQRHAEVPRMTPKQAEALQVGSQQAALCAHRSLLL